jgi:hypothetical protein
MHEVLKGARILVIGGSSGIGLAAFDEVTYELGRTRRDRLIPSLWLALDTRCEDSTTIHRLNDYSPASGLERIPSEAAIESVSQ